MLDVIWTQAKRLISSPDELVFLILFVAFVGFAIHWLFLIMG